MWPAGDEYLIHFKECLTITHPLSFFPAFKAAAINYTVQLCHVVSCYYPICHCVQPSLAWRQLYFVLFCLNQSLVTGVSVLLMSFPERPHNMYSCVISSTLVVFGTMFPSVLFIHVAIF